MTSLFCLLALNFIWIFCSALAQVVIGLSPDSVFSLLSVAISSIHFSLVHSLKCVLDLFFKCQACFPSQATSVLISQPSTQVRASDGCQKTRCFGRVFSLKCYIFHLFLSSFRSSRYFPRALVCPFTRLKSDVLASTESSLASGVHFTPPWILVIVCPSHIQPKLPTR